MFFNGFNEYTRKIFKEDKEKYFVISWIIFNTNYSKDGYNGLEENQCYFSYKIIEEECCIGRTRLQKIMNELEKDGFIVWVYKSTSKNKASILALKSINLEYGSEYGSEYCSEYGLTVENTKVSGKKNTVKNTVENTVQNTSSKKLSKKQSIYSEVVNYLNEKTGSNFRSTTKSTQQLINARMNDKFTVEDFKTVIDKKCAEWLGDPKMEGYLRPKTLFSGENFESYLEQKVSNGSKEIQGEVIKNRYSNYKVY